MRIACERLLVHAQSIQLAQKKKDKVQTRLQKMIRYTEIRPGRLRVRKFRAEPLAEKESEAENRG
jgi:hypothetical protein